MTLELTTPGSVNCPQGLLGAGTGLFPGHSLVMVSGVIRGSASSVATLGWGAGSSGCLGEPQNRAGLCLPSVHAADGWPVHPLQLLPGVLLPYPVPAPTG